MAKNPVPRSSTPKPQKDKHRRSEAPSEKGQTALTGGTDSQLISKSRNQETGILPVMSREQVTANLKHSTHPAKPPFERRGKTGTFRTAGTEGLMSPSRGVISVTWSETENGAGDTKPCKYVGKSKQTLYKTLIMCEEFKRKIVKISRSR